VSGPEPVLAIDIGATKLAAALVGPDGTVWRRAEAGTPRAAAADVVGGALVDLSAQVTEGHRPTAVGIACAGPLDIAAGTASPVNIPAWRGFPVVDLLRSAVPGVPVTLVGDAIAAAIGEHWRGSGRGSQAMLGIVVSTGIGGGLVLNGEPYLGPTGNAGHIGHLSVDPHGVACACGGRGCVEAYASGPAMVRWAVERGWTGTDARQLTEAARSGEPVALTAFDRAADALARGIVATSVLCDLDRAVIGGGVAKAGDLLLAPLRRHITQAATFSFVRRITVHTTALHRDSGLIGAARHTQLGRAGR
jgi:glucokinase